MNRRVAAIVSLCAAIGLSMAVALPGLHTKISAQSLLLEAARDGGPLGDIFEQQAGQGYYDDALATARLAASNLSDQQRELSGLTATLINIRAENGDIQGAKETARELNDSALAGSGPEVILEIAKVQVDKGDLRGALETCASPADTNEVMEEFGNRQIANGDFDGALETAEQVNERSAYNLFYSVGDALRQRGQQERLQELASRMSNKKRATEFLDASRYTLWPSVEYRVVGPSPCQDALSDAAAGRFQDAWSLVERNKCRFISYIAVRQYASDPVEAERKLLAGSDKQDVSRGIAQLSEAAAKKGDLQDAQRLLAIGRKISGDRAFCPDCIQEIAWAWAVKGERSAALDWARSLPVASERGFALLGIAQALAHARPE